MKLFVVREDSPDPDKWSGWSEWSIVVAEDEADARAVVGEDPTTPVCEIPMNRRLHLVTMSEPRMGEDL